jgi:hypothetical protein
MSTYLNGVDAKITRAKHHLLDLEQRIAHVIGPDLQRYAFRHDPQTGNHVITVYGVPLIDPQWSCIVGDCVHNLRSALDHLAHQLVIIDGGQPGKQTYFPIRDQPLYKGQRRLGAPLNPVIRDMNIRDAIEKVQPYNLPVPLAHHHLWITNRLDIIDKHRLLLVMAVTPDPHGMWWDHPEGMTSPTVRVNRAALMDGSVVAWFDFHGTEPPCNFNPHPLIQVTLNEPDTTRLTGMDLTSALRALVGWVEGTVIARHFRHFF